MEEALTSVLIQVLRGEIQVDWEWTEEEIYDELAYRVEANGGIRPTHTPNP